MESSHQILRLIRDNLYDEALREIEKVDDESTKKIYYCQLASAKGNYTKQAEIAGEVLNMTDPDPVARVFATQSLAWAHIRMGNYDTAKDHIDQSLYYFEELTEVEKQEYPPLYSIILNGFGSIAIETGNLDEAITYLENALDIVRQLNYPERVASLQNNLAFALQKKGQLNEALTLYTKSLRYYENNHLGVAKTRVKSNIAEIYRFRSQFDVALQYHKEVLDTRLNYDSDYNTAMSYHYVGLTYFEINSFEKAKDYLQHSWDHWMKVGNNQWMSATLLSLGRTRLALNEDISDILHALRSMAKDECIEIITARYNLLHAIELKKSERMANIAKAQTLLQEIIDAPVIDFELTYSALIHAADILFIELKISSDKKIYEEIRSLIVNLEILTRENGAYGRMIEVMFQKAKVAIIDLQYDDAEKIITQAEFIATERNMDHYLPMINEAREQLNADILKIKQIMEENKDILERAKILELTSYLKQATNIRRDLNERHKQPAE